ncbi:MAG: AAA family ATPase, partial [Myxococcota bacterium]
LFDEIEKADGGVFDLLLQILGEGRSTDDSGHTVRYTHCIIILTSNLGAGRSPALGFSKPNPRQLDRRYLEAAEDFFRPEMINRIDHLVPFQDLGRDSLQKILDGLLTKTLAREGLTRRNLNVKVAESVRSKVLDEGFDPKYGARPMKRAIETRIIAPLARTLTTWKPSDGQNMTLNLVEDDVLIDIA